MMRAIVLTIVSVLLAGQAWAEESVIEMLKRTPASMWDVGSDRFTRALDESLGPLLSTHFRKNITAHSSMLLATLHVGVSGETKEDKEALCKETIRRIKYFSGNMGKGGFAPQAIGAYYTPSWGSSSLYDEVGKRLIAEIDIKVSVYESDPFVSVDCGGRLSDPL